jgi:hypothetical protein
MVTIKPNQYMMSFKPLLYAFLPDDVFVPFRTPGAVIILLLNIRFRFYTYISHVQIAISTPKS